MSFRPFNGPLAGRAVFLSASVPSVDRAERYRRIPQAFARIEEAALRVAGAVFNAGGTLVFGGHPSISPLIGYLCEQYQPSVEAEGQNRRTRDVDATPGRPRVVMFQSEAFRESWAAPSQRLGTLAGVEVIWTASENGEKFDVNRRGQPQCQESLRAMRKRMLGIDQLVAMVAIGGMEGVEVEMEMFRGIREKLPIYAIPSTGGAAQILTDQYPGLVRSFDDEVRAHVREFRRQMRAQQQEGGSARTPADEEEAEILIPYANVASRIVQDIIQNIRNAQQ